MSDGNSSSDEGNSSVDVSATGGIISDSDAYWSEGNLSRQSPDCFHRPDKLNKL